MIRIRLLALPVLVALSIGWLMAVGARSWRRTASLRRGRMPSSPVAGRTWSSATTRIAAGAGTAFGVWGLFVIASRPMLGAVAVLWGTAIAVTRTRSRVSGLAVDDRGVEVRYAGRRPFALAWDDCMGLCPPRWPLGGWVLVGRGTRRTLMPSDVLGQEHALDSIVGFAGMRFDGRTWARRR